MRQAGHRPDIDGLRCLAVTVVVLYHAGTPWMSGGFVGVDVFFVISGFLITALLLDEHDRTGQISLSHFWARRVRRILPALFVVVLATLLVGWLLLLPWDFESLLHSARATMLSFANIHFWQSTGGYFAQGAKPLPLLHMWSLGVEEQFYVALPLIVVGALRWGSRRWLPVVLGVLGLASLTWSVIVVRVDQHTAFYLPQFRAWELLLGSMLALARPLLQRIPHLLASAMAWAGIASIATAVVAYSDDTAFPGTAALVPTMGAAAVIAAGIRARRTSTAMRILSCAPARAVGRWSYSWYLWHWPALVFVRTLERTDSLPRDLVVCLASLGVAALSTRVLETPFRRAAIPPRRAIALGAAAVSIVVVAVIPLLPEPRALSVARSTSSTTSLSPAQPIAGAAQEPTAATTTLPGAPAWPADIDWTSPLGLATLASTEEMPDVPCFGLNADVPFDPDCELRQGVRYVVLVGDSHAAPLAAPLLRLAEARGLGLVIASRFGCPLLPEVAVDYDEGALEECTEWSRLVLADLERNSDRIAVVVSAVRGAWYFPGGGFDNISDYPKIFGVDGVEASSDAWHAGVTRLADQLTSLRIPLVWVHGAPEMRSGPASCLPYSSIAACSSPRPEAERYRRPAFHAEATALRGRSDVATIDPFEILCFEDLCPPARGGTVLYFDSNHLSMTAANLLLPELDRSLRLVLER